MPRASKRTISKKLIKELSDNLTDLISAMKNPEYISVFLNTFLTDEERIMVSKRLMLYMFFEKGLTTTQITGILAVSRQTVITHRKNWIKGDKTYHLIMEKMTRRQKKGEGVWKKINDALYPLDLILESRNNMQARAKLYQGDIERPRNE